MKLVKENCQNDVFENFLRTYGIVAACEWFGYSSDSEFTKETIKYLDGKANKDELNDE
jgi:hypothetical protein